MMLSKAIFAAGSFWEVQSAFEKLPGIIATVIGYIGGNIENPSYLEVSTGNTGHAQAVEIVFDPEQITYNELLDTFFSIHNPTTPNRQGEDYGSQYRSAVFYISEEQKQQALAKIMLLNTSQRYRQPIVTEVTKAGRFWTAEEHHQKYLQKPGQTCCIYKID